MIYCGEQMGRVQMRVFEKNIICYEIILLLKNNGVMFCQYPEIQ